MCIASKTEWVSTENEMILVATADSSLRQKLCSVLEVLGHQVLAASDFAAARAVASRPLDLALVDLRLGTDCISEISHVARTEGNARGPVVIVLTDRDDRRGRAQAAEAGAADVLALPAETAELRLRVSNQIRIRRLEELESRPGVHAHPPPDTAAEARVDPESADQSESMFSPHGATIDTSLLETKPPSEELESLRRSLTELRSVEFEVIQLLGLAAEHRMGQSVDHLHRISGTVRIVGRTMGLDELETERIARASMLHDVGLLLVPQQVLKKTGAWSPAEQQALKEHTVLGGRFLAGSASPVLQTAEVIALTHHERWDGSGYPAGLRGDRIPREGLLCAIADVYDALVTSRPYKPAYPLAEARRILGRASGVHFDPILTAAFLASIDEIDALRSGFGGN